MLIPINLNDVSEPRPVPNGRYDLVIASVEETVTKEKGKPQLRVSMGIQGHDDAPNLTHFVGLPGEGDEPRTAQFKSLMLKRFLSLFSIPFDSSGFSLDDFPGATATAELTIDESGDYNRLVVPKMHDEPTAVRAVAGAARLPKR
ncbi:MAG: hypothetical protein ACYDB1_00715 [Acidiferrobacteraceae bacterium]